MTITSFDRDTVKQIVKDIDAALATVAAKHGIKVRATRTTYDLAEFSTKVVATIEAAKVDEDLKNATMFADMLGIDISQPSTFPQRLGAVVTGYNTRSRSKPWQFTWKGQRYVGPDSTIRLMFPAKASSVKATEASNLIGREVAPPR